MAARLASRRCPRPVPQTRPLARAPAHDRALRQRHRGGGGVARRAAAGGNVSGHFRVQRGRLRQIVTRRLAAPTMAALADVLQQLQRQISGIAPQTIWVTGFGLQPDDSSVLSPAQCVGDLSASQPLSEPMSASLSAPTSAAKPMRAPMPVPALYFMAPARRYPSWVWLCLAVLALANGALSSHWLTQREAPIA